MLRSVGCTKRFLLLETFLTRMDSGNSRHVMIPLSKNSEILYCTIQRMYNSRTFHTNVCRRQLKEKTSERHNSLIEAKDKPFSELTFGDKGEKVEITGSS